MQAAKEHNETIEINKYIDSLTIKALALESECTEIRRGLHSADSTILDLSKKFSTELHDLKTSLQKSEKQLAEIDASLGRMIDGFRQVVKKEDLQRLELFIDDIPFDQFISRKELKTSLP